MKKTSPTDFSSRNKPQFGNRRSKALNATKRQFRLNLQVFRFVDAIGKHHKVHLPVRELRKLKSLIVVKNDGESKGPAVVASPTSLKKKPSPTPVVNSPAKPTKKTSVITKTIKKSATPIKKSATPIKKLPSKIVKSKTVAKTKTVTKAKTPKVSKPTKTKTLKKTTTATKKTVDKI